MKFFDKVERIILQFSFNGLKGRYIDNDEIPGLRRDIYVSRIPKFSVGVTVKPEEIGNNLAEVIYVILKRLYEQFNFCSLNVEFVANELKKLRRNRFN